MTPQSRLALAEREYSLAVSSWNASPEAIKRASDELREARWEAADDAGKARILETRAVDKDAEAATFLKMAADHAGMAAGRRLKGIEDDTTAYHASCARTCDKLAEEAADDALRLRFQAAALFGPIRFGELADTVRVIAATHGRAAA